MSFRKIATSLLLFLCLPVATSLAIPERPPREHAVDVNELLAEAKDKSGISAWAGVEPKNCIKSSDVVEVCEWEITKRQEHWDEIRVAIDTRKRVSLICVLPTDGGERLAASCSARPQQSNKAIFDTAKIKPAKGVTEKDVRDVYQRLAQSWLDEARTLASMSQLIGATPKVCRSNARGEQICIWDLDSRVYGNGTVAMSLDLRIGSEVELRCIFPTDGRPRGEDSCEASLDD